MTTTTTDLNTRLQAAARQMLDGVRRARHQRQVLEEHQEAAWCQQEAAEREGLELDPDEALVWRHGADAVALAAPDEARVLVRASVMLASGAEPAVVCEALAAWAARYPDLVGTAPRVADPWQAAIAAARPAPCPHLFRPGWGPLLQRCIRAAGHEGDHDSGPF